MRSGRGRTPRCSCTSTRSTARALVHALDGMYAFALWDARREMLLLARDRFGEKPLFVREAQTARLTFASELTRFAARHRRGRAELDPASVDLFFTLGYVPGPQTIYAGVEQLQPGNDRRVASGTAAAPLAVLVASRVATARGRRATSAAGRGDGHRSCGGQSRAGWSPTCRSGSSSAAASTRRSWRRTRRGSPGRSC